MHAGKMLHIRSADISKQFFAPILHELAFISVIMIEKLIHFYYNCITWLLSHFPWNLNGVSA